MNNTPPMRGLSPRVVGIRLKGLPTPALEIITGCDSSRKFVVYDADSGTSATLSPGSVLEHDEPIHGWGCALWFFSMVCRRVTTHPNMTMLFCLFLRSSSNSREQRLGWHQYHSLSLDTPTKPFGWQLECSDGGQGPSLPVYSCSASDLRYGDSMAILGYTLRWA